MERKIRTAALLGVLACLVVAPASADNTTAANSRALPPGVAVPDTVAQGGAQWYDVQLVTGRSYAYVAWDPFADLATRTQFIVQMFNEDGTTSAPTAFFVGEPNFPTGSAYQSIIPTVDTPSRGNRYKLRVTHIGTGTVNVMVAIFETTLSSPWFFRDANYDGIVEIRNHTNSPLQVRTTVYNHAGAVICSLTDTIVKNGGDVFGVGAECGLASAFGTVQISHSGAPGAVTANITTLSGNTGLSFDAPFTPRHVYAGFTQSNLP